VLLALHAVLRISVGTAACIARRISDIGRKCCIARRASDIGRNCYLHCTLCYVGKKCYLLPPHEREILWLGWWRSVWRMIRHTFKMKWTDRWHIAVENVDWCWLLLHQSGGAYFEGKTDVKPKIMTRLMHLNLVKSDSLYHTVEFREQQLWRWDLSVPALLCQLFL